MNRTMSSYRSSLPGLLSGGALAFVAVAHAQTPSATLAMEVPVVKGAVQIGTVPPTTRLSMTVSLAPRSQAGLEAYAASVSDPTNPKYRHFLSPQQIGQMFGPDMSTVNTVAAYLKAKGMTVTRIASNLMAIQCTGRADKVSSAFATKLALFSAPNRTDGGRTKFFTYTMVPKAPPAFARSIVSIDGLQNAFVPTHQSTLSPNQARVLYKAASLFGSSSSGGRKGEGVNIGVTNYDGYRLSNLPLYYSLYNLPSPTSGVGSNVIKIAVNGTSGDGTPPYASEGDLDIQNVLGAAPKANLYVYDAGNVVSGDTYLADYVSPLVREADDNIVDIVTESYVFTTFNNDESIRSSIQAAHNQHVSMTAQGITYLEASGDYGTLYQAPAYPHFDPEVTNVGGTVATVDASGNRISEVGWIGSGGGYSNFDISFNRLPSYQKGNGVPTGIDRRLIPDLALHASGANLSFDDDNYFKSSENFAYPIVVNGFSTVVSGTSAAAPLLAGQLATILQELTAQGTGDPASNGRIRIGRINDFVYDLNGDSSVFFDITDGGSNGTLPNGQVAQTQAGWDFVTGWGTPNIDGMLDAFVANASVPLVDGAISASLFTGSNLSNATRDASTGLVTSLTSTDGNLITVTSARQPGIGQVGATTIDIKLSNTNRRSATLNVTLTAPELTTGYVYLYDWSTGKFDQAASNITTVTGNGNSRVVRRVLNLDANNIDPTTQTVRILVRALKPARLGNVPFTFTVDQATVTERIPRSD